MFKNLFSKIKKNLEIGNYTVYKATMSREVPQQIFQFGRQSDQESKPKTKTVNITAWFTPQIPVSTGPAKHGGLPGLILEVNTDNTSILCTKVVMNPKEKIKRVTSLYQGNF